LFHAGKFFQHGPEIFSSVGAERSWHVFPNSESWIQSICRFPHFFYDSNRFHEQPGAFSSKSSPASSNGQILTRASERDAIHRLYLVSVNLCDVAQVLHFSKRPSSQIAQLLYKVGGSPFVPVA
jgi:hypothetical protein